MDKVEYKIFENYMLARMNDSAHDKEHVYRVLYNALDIAEHEPDVDTDILIIACLLHDIGRDAQFENSKVCHADAGSELAYNFCVEHGLSEQRARHVRDCIATHRYRVDNPPKSIEAKILFDADKLDVTGAIGIARTLFYKGTVGEPLYNTDEKGRVIDGINDDRPSFLYEYNYKLKNIYSKFNTERGRELAAGRQESANLFYESIVREVSSAYDNGQALLDSVLK